MFYNAFEKLTKGNDNMLKDLILKNRSYRRFDNSYNISYEELLEMIDNARFTPSTVNSQALKFLPVNDKEKCAKVFETLSWAGLLRDWDGPKENERPSAYIIILCDLSIGKNKMYDDGIAAQTIMLSAVEKGLGGCILGAINKEKLAESLDIDAEKYSIDLVLALGKPNENIILVDIPEGEGTAYYRDESGNHYVPKRSLDELIIK